MRRPLCETLAARLLFGTQIYTDLERFFYLLYLLNLRETFAAWGAICRHNVHKPKVQQQSLLAP